MFIVHRWRSGHARRELGQQHGSRYDMPQRRKRSNARGCKPEGWHAHFGQLDVSFLYARGAHSEEHWGRERRLYKRSCSARTSFRQSPGARRFLRAAVRPTILSSLNITRLAKAQSAQQTTRMSERLAKHESLLTHPHTSQPLHRPEYSSTAPDGTISSSMTAPSRGAIRALHEPARRGHWQRHTLPAAMRLVACWRGGGHGRSRGADELREALAHAAHDGGVGRGGGHATAEADAGIDVGVGVARTAQATWTRAWREGRPCGGRGRQRSSRTARRKECCACACGGGGWRGRGPACA